MVFHRYAVVDGKRLFYREAGDPAPAFAEDLPDAEIHLLPGGHFLLETAVDEVAGLMRKFLTPGRGL